MDFFWDYVISRHKQFIEERLRWQHLNDSMTLSLRAKGYDKAPLYNDTIKKLDDDTPQVVDDRTDEDIIEDTLALFK